MRTVCVVIYCSNWDGVQNVITSMNNGGISLDYDYYNNILGAFARSGNVDNTKKVMLVLY